MGEAEGGDGYTWALDVRHYDHGGSSHGSQVVPLGIAPVSHRCDGSARGAGRTENQAESARFRVAARCRHDDRARVQPARRPWPRSLRRARAVRQDLVPVCRRRDDDRALDRHQDRWPGSGCREYSVWTIPNDGKWTVIFNRRAATWHTRYPDGQDALASKSPRVRARTWRRWRFTFRQSTGKRLSSCSIGARQSCRSPSKFHSAPGRGRSPVSSLRGRWCLRRRNFAR